MVHPGKNRQTESGPDALINIGKDTGRTNLALTAILAPSFYALEWGLVGATAALVTFLKFKGLSDVAIWLVLWALNLLFSGAVVLCNDRTTVDFTLMETSRRWTNAAAQKSKWAGYVIELIVFIRLLLWDGPCMLVIYFKERLPSGLLRAGVFVAASGFQMFIWAQLYILGFESIGDLLKAIR